MRREKRSAFESTDSRNRRIRRSFWQWTCLLAIAAGFIPLLQFQHGWLPDAISAYVSMTWIAVCAVVALAAASRWYVPSYIRALARGEMIGAPSFVEVARQKRRAMRFWGYTLLLAVASAVVGYLGGSHSVPGSSVALAYASAFGGGGIVGFVALCRWMNAATAALENERAAYVAKYPPAPTPEPSADDQIAYAYQCGVLMGMAFPFD